MPRRNEIAQMRGRAHSDHHHAESGGRRVILPEQQRLVSRVCASSKTELAMEGNVTMLIWLGKQRLGQRDRLDTEHSGSEGGPIPVIIMPSADEDE